MGAKIQNIDKFKLDGAGGLDDFLSNNIISAIVSEGEIINAGDLVALIDGNNKASKNYIDGNIDLGNAYVIANEVPDIVRAVKLTDNTVFIAYVVAGTGKAVIATISGNSISFGSIYTFDTTIAKDYPSLTVEKISSSQVVVVYTKGSSAVYARVATVTGTTISFGSVNSCATTRAVCVLDSALLTPSSIIIVYDSGNYGVLYYRAGTISGNTITFGSEYSISARQGFVAAISSTQAILCYDGGCCILTVSGTTISTGSATSLRINSDESSSYPINVIYLGSSLALVSLGYSSLSVLRTVLVTTSNPPTINHWLHDGNPIGMLDKINDYMGMSLNTSNILRLFTIDNINKKMSVKAYNIPSITLRWHGWIWVQDAFVVMSIIDNICKNIAIYADAANSNYITARIFNIIGKHYSGVALNSGTAGQTIQIQLFK